MFHKLAYLKEKKIEISIINLVGCVNESSLTRKIFVGCPAFNSEIKVFHVIFKMNFFLKFC